MSGEKVWSCIKSYRTNDATQIMKLYGYNEALIKKTLDDSYKEVNEYHGHGSDPSGQGGENSATAGRLKNAISHLKSYAPTEINDGKQEVNNANLYVEKAETLASSLDEVIANWKHVGPEKVEEELQKFQPGWYNSGPGLEKYNDYQRSRKKPDIKKRKYFADKYG